MVANALSDPSGQPLVVESQLGAGGTIAVEAVARSLSDAWRRTPPR